jgi:thiamine-monophosphate kinase
LSTPAESSATHVAELGERGLIDRIRRRLPAAPSSVIVGIGDDAAVAVPERGALQILTTDALVEGVHFDRRLSTLADVGYKALAVNASDVAAMGGSPQLALLSLMLPPSTAIADIDALLDGIVEMAAEGRIALVGGNITRSPGPLVVDVTMTGAVRPRKLLTRGGGRAGDVLYVTGSIGGGAAGLAILREAHELHPTTVPDDPALAGAVRRYRRPAPRLRIGALLGRNRAATACMDLSDGLADAVRQIAEASGTGATVDAAALPLDEGARTWFQRHDQDPVTACVAGGDDYELVFASPRRFRGRLRSVHGLARGVPITAIGELTAGTDVALVREGRSEPLPGGFAHF